jgi:hypothetical protein
LWIDGVLTVDNSVASVDFSGGAGAGIGSYVLWVYQTGRGENDDSLPASYTYFDDVIVSTNPIAMLSGGTGPQSYFQSFADSASLNEFEGGKASHRRSFADSATLNELESTLKAGERLNRRVHRQLL